ncbi:MAG: hypothetical protein KF860_07310 [Cyclobacteriaceae bacterium]|nr:hypothetical protein [Cyclobacteriaceae bacterium]
MKLKIFSFTILLFSVVSAFAQLERIKELNLPNVSTGSVDRLGNFYFVLPNGKIQKFDPNGSLMDETTKSILPLTLLEPWNPLKVFIFSSQTKKYCFLDHHLSLLEEKTLEPSLSINPLLLCPANEVPKAWILDVADYSIKKVNLATNEIEVDATLPPEWAGENSDYVFMREYQNKVFLLDKNRGILMLNMLGKPITTINVKGLDFFNFMGEELCYRKDSQVLLFDLYTGETRVIADLPEPDGILFTIITDERLVVGREEKIIFYSLSQ